MRTLTGLVMVGGLLLGMTGESKAQFSLSIGNPYYGTGYGLGGYGYSGLGYGGLGGYNNVYNTGVYSGLGGFSYSSGYAGLAAPVAPLNTFGYGYGVRPYYGGYGYRPYYGGYGYRGYGYGVRRGFAPFRGIGRMFR